MDLVKGEWFDLYEITVVDVADRWRERNVWYLGRSRQQMETE